MTNYTVSYDCMYILFLMVRFSQRDMITVTFNEMKIKRKNI